MKVTYELDGEHKSINIPFSCEEISFNDFCDFKSFESKFFEAIKSDDRDDSEVSSLMLRTVSTMIKGDVSSLPLSINEGIDELFENQFQLSINEELSVVRLYVHLVNLIQSFTPEEIPSSVYDFNHAGDSFKIKSAPAARILSGRSLTVGESIELLEYQRRANNSIKQGNDIGNIEFNLGLTEFAILVRKENEPLPSGRRQLDKFISDRKQLFKSLPLSEVLSIRFFFIRALLELKKIRTTNFSGKAARL